MSVKDVFDNSQYRALTQQVLRSACETSHVNVASVEFARKGYRDGYSWLCFVVDPLSADLVAALTGSSAADHFALVDPNGFARNAGSRVNLTVFEIEISTEASMLIRNDEGTPTLYSPWHANLAVAKALFNVTPAN
jgi:hypothetical protein